MRGDFNMKNTKFLALMLVAGLMTACFDNVPKVEELPSDAVSFEYKINGDYSLDYYIDSDIEFTSTSRAAGAAHWAFGDGQEADGDVVKHAYDAPGTYKVRLTIKGSDGVEQHKDRVIMVVDIKPLMTINPFENAEGICEVLTTPVSFSLELPNPKNRKAEYEWIFPEGTTNENGEVMESCTTELPGKLKFANVGSQTVRLRVKLDGRELEEATINVQVAYNKPVPTLYYATVGGNIMAYKLADDAPEGMKIAPFDLGVSSGQHPFNILFKDSSLYVLDAGKQFYYVNDEDGVLGDGKISVLSKDGKKVETMITNAGQAAFDDPFYGAIDGDYLFYANRNTGIIRLPLNARDKVYSASENPYYVQHTTLGYYNNGWSYGSIGGCFGKVQGTWYWCKFYNGNGIFRFTDGDILPNIIAQGDDSNKPQAGIALSGMKPKSFAYDAKLGKFYFTVWDEGYAGFYACTLEELEAIGSSKSKLNPYKKLSVNGLGFEPNTTGSPASVEGTLSEVVGVTQLALDEASGCVYFGYRNTQGDATCEPTGVYRYNPTLDKIEPVLVGSSVYGVVINNTPAKLF